jgi:regulatory protein
MYSDSKARMFLRRGYSLNKINQSLRNKGIDNKFIKQSIDKIKEDNIEPDFVSALKLCKRRRIGPLRPDDNRELFYKKGGKNMGYPKKHRGRRKIGSKKRRARKRNKKK